MTDLEAVAPRLARAHAAEREYQRRKAAARGSIPWDIGLEEMVRSLRSMTRSTALLKLLNSAQGRSDG